MQSAVSNHGPQSGTFSAVQESTSPSIFDAQTEAIRHHEIGTLLLNNSRYEDALCRFEQALALQPHAADHWYGRAEALACLSRYEEALSSLEQAQDLTHLSDVRIWVQKATVLILLGRYEAALSCCALVLQREPDHIQALLFQGVAWHRLGQFRKAYRSYRRVIVLTNPQSSHQFRRADNAPQSYPSVG